MTPEYANERQWEGRYGGSRKELQNYNLPDHYRQPYDTLGLAERKLRGVEGPIDIPYQPYGKSPY